jgi:hypothetical protein
MLGITTTEAWVRLLREIFSYTSKGDGPARVPVQVSTGFPFADIPDNSNLPNDPTLATLSSKGAVNLPNRRDLTLPEITVHDLGESMPKKYMDNFIGYFYSKEIKIVKDMVPKISRIKNVFLEQPNKKTLVLKENEHFVFDRERGAIVFEIEFYPYIPLGTKTKYIADLFFETQAGIAEHIGEGVIESGEIFGTLHSLEVDAKLQIDLWGGNQKQAQWLLQRFREMWINERLLRQNLARHGLPCTMNLSWDHGGIKSSLDGRFRPYMYNITCKVYFNTEYKVLTLVSDYAERFKDLDAAVAIYDRVPPAIDGMPARRYTGLLAVEPYNVGYVLLGGYPKI